VRSTIISEIRRNLDKAGFLEVETPMLQELAGGASVWPGEPVSVTVTQGSGFPGSGTFSVYIRNGVLEYGSIELGG
jgi:hypothetical protein